MAEPITKARVEHLMRQCGHAINRNNGRCGFIEDVLCQVTTLCVELLNEIDYGGHSAANQAAAEIDERWQKIDEEAAYDAIVEQSDEAYSFTRRRLLSEIIERYLRSEPTNNANPSGAQNV